MEVNIKITMKSGKEFLLDKVDADMNSIQRQVNKLNFIRFGPVVVNCSEIESIVKV